MSSAWSGNWRGRLLRRLSTLCFVTLSEYLHENQGLSYFDIANYLGENDFAAIQIEWLQFEEAIQQNKFREAAMDSLLREILHHLSDGWRREPQTDFQAASVWADWIVRLEDYSKNVRPIATQVWNKIVSSPPPLGWKPKNTEDSIIVFAFLTGWPNNALVETQAPLRPN